MCSVETSVTVIANNHCRKKLLVPRANNIQRFGKRTLMLPNTSKTISVPVWIIVLAVIGALVVMVVVIITISAGGFYLIWRWRNKRINSDE